MYFTGRGDEASKVGEKGFHFISLLKFKQSIKTHCTFAMTVCYNYTKAKSLYSSK
jgi:hypothetical protein